MCMEYEMEYGHCFDGLVGEVAGEADLRPWLQEHYDVEVVDSHTFATRLFALLADLYRTGAIRPILEEVP